MNARAPLVKGRGRTLQALMDVFWVLSFLATWGGLILLWDTPWTFPLMFLFTCHLGGLSEFVHQAVHLNLFARSRAWNRGAGRVAAAMLCMDFETYRTFHLDHHRFVNTLEDPERPIFADPALVAIGRGWDGLTPLRKIGRTFLLARYVAKALGSFGGTKLLVRTVRFGIPIAIAASGVIAGLPWYLVVAKVAIAWYVPLLFLLFVDIVFAQSEHYGTPTLEAGPNGMVPIVTQYAVSWNLTLPAFLAFFFLKRNIHAEHHLSPSLHWTQARDGGAGRELRISGYLMTLWKRGPRTIPPTESVRSA